MKDVLTILLAAIACVGVAVLWPQASAPETGATPPDAIGVVATALP